MITEYDKNDVKKEVVKWLQNSALFQTASLCAVLTYK